MNELTPNDPEYWARSGTEHGEQVALFCWAANEARNGHADIGKLFAIPNGGKRDGATAARMRAEGVKAGIPDLCLPLARGGFHGLFIELKKLSGKPPTGEQKRRMAELVDDGYCALTCYGWESARRTIISYLCSGTWEKE